MRTPPRRGCDGSATIFGGDNNNNKKKITFSLNCVLTGVISRFYVLSVSTLTETPLGMYVSTISPLMIFADFQWCFRRVGYESCWSACWWLADNESDCPRVRRYVLTTFVCGFFIYIYLHTHTQYDRLCIETTTRAEYTTRRVYVGCVADGPISFSDCSPPVIMYTRWPLDVVAVCPRTRGGESVWKTTN